MGEYPERDGIAAMHVAYLPPDKLIGLSKIPRIVDMFARRLQAQEPLTREMAEATAEETAQRIVGRPLRGGRGLKLGWCTTVITPPVVSPPARGAWIA